MGAEVRRGYLYCEDEKGFYKIPLGRKARKCLAVLDQREGEYVRSLELDLFTGFVYYCVDNETSGGLSYYYDMSSKKVGHFFIHRYLRNARNHGFTFSPLEMEVFEKLPCDDWEKEVSRLPGWDSVIRNRVRNLLLPQREPQRISLPADLDRQALPEAAELRISIAPAAYPVNARKHSFLFEERGGKTVLRHRDEVVGSEFFGEDEEYERILSPEEWIWLRLIIRELVQPKLDFAELFPADPAEFLPDSGDILVKQVEINCSDGTSVVLETAFDSGKAAGSVCPASGRMPGGAGTASIDGKYSQETSRALYAALRGLMRRELEI